MSGYLIMSRRPDEGFTMTLPDGRKGYIDILSVSGKQVRVGFKLDKDISVNRNEIEERIEADSDGEVLG